MKFSAELSDPRLLKDALAPFYDVADEAKMIVANEGVRITSLNGARTTFIDLLLGKELFDEYDVDDAFESPIDTYTFFQVMKKIGRDDRLSWVIDDYDLSLTFIGESETRFRMGLVDTDYDLPPLPDFEYPASFIMPCSVLSKALGDISFFSDKCRFRVDDVSLLLTGDGIAADARMRYLHGVKVREDVSSLFNIYSLLPFFKAKRLGEDCTVNVGQDMPITLSYDIGDSDGYLKYILAPRLEAEE